MSNRRFGTANKFGTTNQFGATSGIERKITFVLEIDWDGDRLFDGYNEATNRLVSWYERRGREFFFNSSGDGFQPVQTGEITFTLLNLDGRYDPYNLDGPLVEYLSTNPLCRFRVQDETTGTVYPDFFGYVVDVRPIYGPADMVEIVVYDGVQKLKDITVRGSAVETNATYDDRIESALFSGGWKDGRVLDSTLSDSMSYHWFRGQSVFDEITSLVNASFGLFFVDRNGQAVYKSRISSDVSVMTLEEADTDKAYRIRIPSPKEVVRNVVRVYARARRLQTGVELWRLADTPQIATGAGAPIWANYSYNGEEVPALTVTEPEATTDYTAHANADGTGTNRTANFSFERTGFATASKLVPSNSGPAAYITLLKLRGNAIIPDNYTYVEVEDEDSIEQYGRRELVINSDWLQDVNTAADQATLFLGRFSNPRKFPRVKIKRNLLDKQYGADLFDLVTINFASRNISEEMRVGFIERSWTQSEPNVIDTVMYFEPNMTISSSGAWIFPITFPATLA